jgi:hypothetical protein
VDPVRFAAPGFCGVVTCVKDGGTATVSEMREEV